MKLLILGIACPKIKINLVFGLVSNVLSLCGPRARARTHKIRKSNPKGGLCRVPPAFDARWRHKPFFNKYIWGVCFGGRAPRPRKNPKNTRNKKPMTFVPPLI